MKKPNHVKKMIANTKTIPIDIIAQIYIESLFIVDSVSFLYKNVN